MATVTEKMRLVVDAADRKSRAAAQRLPRAVVGRTADEFDRVHRPPVIVATVPKSGTHLVQQIVSALPGVRDYGRFVASVRSWGRRPVAATGEAKRIRSLVPGELLRAHLYHRPEVVDAVRERKAFMVFVHRDPRDVIVSEAHYLADAAPWHPLHTEFASRTPVERIDIGIDGLDGHHGIYPDAQIRFGRFAGWLDDADVVLRYEDLGDERREATIRGLVVAYKRTSRLDLDVDEVVASALDAIDPQRSHTFREGRTGAWREVFTPAQAERFLRIAEPMLARYGYESSGAAPARAEA